jgi:hypothetical protein
VAVESVQEMEPGLQRLAPGAEEKLPPLDEPQVPLTTGVPPPPPPERGALQLAGEPPPLPVQFQVHPPVPETPEEVPVLQKPEVGTLATAIPLAPPQVPSTGLGREQ